VGVGHGVHVRPSLCPRMDGGYTFVTTEVSVLVPEDAHLSREEQLMDPDATLARIRELVVDVQAHSTSEPALDLADQIEALDSWMSRNGFAPIAWRPK
jgi:hypothetical protein